MKSRPTRLYSSSQHSSSQAPIHLSTFSSISFLLKASSFTLPIRISICSRRLPASTAPLFYIMKSIYQSIFQIQQLQKITFYYLPDSIASRAISSEVSDSGSKCVFLQISSNSDLFLKTSSFILLAFKLSSLDTSASTLNVKKNFRTFRS